MNEKLRKTILAAVFAALICAATLLIRIPTITKGYVNPGDGFVILAGWICGGPWGFTAAALGSALADIIAGYTVFAPATFIIKGCMALIAVAGVRVFANHTNVGRIAGAITAELFMAAGYCVFETIFITGSFEAALIGVPENLIQGFVGVLCSVTVMTALEKTRGLNRKY
ncbi:MAG: ECF transporter S component [Ruminiclostridium sp.]|nr:ECF transporter S component [Ruminiclostridium sp.]